MSAVAVPQPVDSPAAIRWALIASRAPQLADTMGRYLSQVATFLAPRSVEAAESALRQMAGWLVNHTEIATVARNDIEDYKVWLAAQPGVHGRLSATTQRQRLRTLRAFFERIIE
jgi:site-specific recombinase XerD